MRKKDRPKDRRADRLGLLLPRRGDRRRSEILAGVALSMLVVSIFLVSSIDRFLIGTNQYASVIAAVLVDLVNSDRFTQSAGALHVNPVLAAAAQAKANDMAAKGYFAHVSPEGKDSWYWFKEAGYNFNYAGENLAVDFSDSSEVERAWMNSPTHRQNLLDPHFTEIGIATAEGTFQGRPTIFVAQMFGAPAVARSDSGDAESERPAGAAEDVAIRELTSSQTPTEPALATTLPAPTSVLGASADEPAVQAAAPIADIRTPSADAPIGAVVRYAPWWAHLFASPRQTLHYAYYLLGILIALVLALTTGLEIRWHHRRKAAAAGVALALISTLFLVGDYAVFTDPVLTQNASMTAAAGLAY